MQGMLKQKLTDDLKTSLKSADQETVGVLRLISTAIKNHEIEKRTKTGEGELSDDEIIKVLMSEAKKRKDSIEAFRNAGREDLASKEEKELMVIQRYLPKQLTPEEIEPIIDKIISSAHDKSFASVMKEAMRQLSGQADGKTVSEIIKQKLS